MDEHLAKQISDFIKESREDIISKDIDGNYCVILYTESNRVRINKAIYKTIDDFEKRSGEVIDSIDLGIGVGVQLWLFD